MSVVSGPMIRPDQDMALLKAIGLELRDEFVQPERKRGDWCKISEKSKDQSWHGYLNVLHPVHGRIMVKL